MRVLGIDPGSRHTGFAVVEEAAGSLRLVCCGTFSPAATLPLAARLAAIHEGLRQVVARTSPDAASIEEIFHAENARSALVLGQARGAALVAAVSGGASLHEYAATEIKRSVVGTGRAEKEQVQRMVALLLGGPVAGDEHACDAIAAAICHLHRARIPVAARAIPGAPRRRPARSAALALARRGRPAVITPGRGGRP